MDQIIQIIWGVLSVKRGQGNQCVFISIEKQKKEKKNEDMI